MTPHHSALSDIQLFFLGAFDRALESTSTPLELFRHAIETTDAELRDRFLKGHPVSELVHHRAWVIDEILIRAWRRFIDHDRDVALLAVGGYGRGELHPNSDIDVLILVETENRSVYQENIEKLLAFLWDIGLEIGHSVRSPQECVDAAREDITIITNLIESRSLVGGEHLVRRLQELIDPSKLWPAREFFAAKSEEQQQRHRKYHDTAYNLEPNVKEGPGGLRDLQMIGWVTRRHFGSNTLQDLVSNNFLTDAEYHDLMACQDYLWRIRYGLHVLTGRNENRLLFDHQQPLAKQFGYADDGRRLGVEKMMKDYYRTITELSRLNEMLLQLFEEAILHSNIAIERIAVNKRFVTCNGFLEASDPGVFRRYPFALLELFLLLEQRPEIKGVRASTIRLVRNHRHLIDDKFRKDLACRSLFMEILRQPQGITHQLRRMNRYGILAAYCPAFGEIVGQMQYDLFHVYTVDDHTLNVIRNLRRFTLAIHQDEFPLCSTVIKRIPKPEILYLAALFHDIAKGRGGDHSVLGEQEAVAFCRLHELSEYDTELVAWLVRHHLIMSVTAQQKDIKDPEVVTEFAHFVGNITRLEHLYLLTVADICGTNPTLWNSWKEVLLNELYSSTRQALIRGLENPIQKSEQISAAQSAALALLGDLDAGRVHAFWGGLDQDYFLRHPADGIAWHTRAILNASDEQLPMILLRQETQRGGTEIFLYARDREHLFALTTMALDQMRLNTVEAGIITTPDGRTLNTFVVLDESGNPISDQHRIDDIPVYMKRYLKQDKIASLRVSRRPHRLLKHFSIPTKVYFTEDIKQRYTIAELVTNDRPGLLARIGLAFVDCGVRLHNAKIATFGARVEDVFFITDRHNRPLTEAAQKDHLRETLIRFVDDDESKD